MYIFEQTEKKKAKLRKIKKEKEKEIFIDKNWGSFYWKKL